MKMSRDKTCAARSALLLALLIISAAAGAQSSVLPDSATPALPELGVVAPQPASSAPQAGDMKPRRKLELKPRMKSDELKPELRPEFKPEMSPGLQPNSQKPLRTDAPTRRNN